MVIRKRKKVEHKECQKRKKIAVNKRSNKGVENHNQKKEKEN